MLPFLLLQPSRQVSAHTRRVSLQVLFCEDVEDGEPDGARHRVPAKLSDSKDEGGVRAEVAVGGSGLTVLKYSIPDAAKASATSGVVTTQDMGWPFAIGFPMVTMSGTKSSP